MNHISRFESVVCLGSVFFEQEYHLACSFSPVIPVISTVTVSEQRLSVVGG